MTHRTHRTPLVVLLLLLTLAACSKAIGDSCSFASDCSINNDQACDTSQPDGYCTVVRCDPDTCPNYALCVNFEAQAPRLARTYCMAGCDQDSDCRTGYFCRHTDDPRSAPCTSGLATLPLGTTCNVIVDRQPTHQSWCVQGPAGP